MDVSIITPPVYILLFSFGRYHFDDFHRASLERKKKTYHNFVYLGLVNAYFLFYLPGMATMNNNDFISDPLLLS